MRFLSVGGADLNQRERAYHGVTVAAGSLTSLPANLAHFDAPYFPQ